MRSVSVVVSVAVRLSPVGRVNRSCLPGRPCGCCDCAESLFVVEAGPVGETGTSAVEVAVSIAVVVVSCGSAVGSGACCSVCVSEVACCCGGSGAVLADGVAAPACAGV